VLSHHTTELDALIAGDRAFPGRQEEGSGEDGEIYSWGHVEGDEVGEFGVVEGGVFEVST
jgi:hypothetical protein